jgi:V/A-type H+-transporting ATPase subunit C
MMKSYVTSQVVVSDIKIAVRSAKTGKSYAFLKEALAECDAISAEGLAQAASRGEDALFTYLQESGFSEAADAIRQSPSAFDRWCDDRLIETIRPQRMNSVSVSPVVAFYLARENEIRMARIILTAKANGFGEETIRERVRKMYV